MGSASSEGEPEKPTAKAARTRPTRRGRNTLGPGALRPPQKAFMSTNAAAYPRWEYADPVSRFMIGPGFAFYEVKELSLIGGSLFVASALDTLELIGQFESKSHAQQACARDFARRKAAGGLSQTTLGSRDR
jgi:hypothetical protein